LDSITCYGGVGTIGGNKILLEISDSSIFLDFGLNFGAEGNYFEEFLQPRTQSKLHDLLNLGLLPKIDGIYREDALTPLGIEDIEDNSSKALWDSDVQSYEKAKDRCDWYPDAVFISHAHMDHCGYLPYLGNMPVICSSETNTLMEAFEDIANLDGFDNDLTKLQKRKIDTFGSRSYFPGEYKIKKGKMEKRKIVELEHGGRHSLSSKNINLEAIEVDHSITGALSSLIESGDKQVVYTGDIRFHGRKQNRIIEELEGLKPDVMLCEGTRIDKTEPDNEERVETKLIDVFSNTKGLAMIGFAWKDLDRYETVKNAAHEVGRIPVFDPRLAYLKAIFDESVYKEDARVFIERTFSMLYSPGDYTRCKHKCGELPAEEWDNKDDVTDTVHLEKGISAVDINREPEKYVLQLDYYRFKNLFDLNLPEGSIYIRAQAEPFNEEMELTEERLINWLKHFGINKENDYNPINIHASGHASGPQIQDMIDAIQPKKLIPIHTEHPELFENKNGQIYPPVNGKKIRY